MTQPCGRVCYRPQRQQILLSSSPIVCSFDGIARLVEGLARCLFALQNACSAARNMLIQRFAPDTQQPGSSGTSNNESSVEAIKNVRSHKWCRYTVFALGVLPQVIKIFGRTGIGWLQTWAAMYLSGWVMFECLLLVAGSIENNVDLQNPFPQLARLSPAKWWSLAALFGHAVLYSLLPLWIDNNFALG
jgi:hypothetical protein